MLEARNITIKYGSREIVKDISFDLAEGKIIALLGANGAGKTTLIRSLNGIVPLSGGSIRVEGNAISSLSRRDIAKRIAVVAQENETRFPVTVLEFVLSGRFIHGSAFGFEGPKDIDISLNALNLCDLKNYDDRLMNELSGGERQRVVLARALASDANILLLDEPTANLDLSHQALMFRLVRERCQSCKAGAVIITHDLNLASEFADEIMFLKGGNLIAHGAPGEVLKKGTLREVFDVEVLVDAHPMSRKPRITMNYF